MYYSLVSLLSCPPLLVVGVLRDCPVARTEGTGVGGDVETSAGDLGVLFSGCLYGGNPRSRDLRDVPGRVPLEVGEQESGDVGSRPVTTTYYSVSVQGVCWDLGGATPLSS